MGSSQSKRWRELPGEGSFDKADQYYRREIEKMKFHTKGENYNVLIIGQTGAGKSSYINSVMTVIAGSYENHHTIRNPKSKSSGTTQFNDSQKEGDAIIGNVTFYDTMGVQIDETGIPDEEVKCAAEGKLTPGFKFNTKSAIGSLATTRPHCVIHVVMAVVFEDLTKDTQEPIRSKLENMYDLIPNEIPQILVITHCDEICLHVKEDVGKIYESQKVQDVVRNSRSIIGLDSQDVFPVVNYFGEKCNDITTKQNVPLLNSFYHCIKAAHIRNKFKVKKNDN